ncbi:MAG: pentapeptide repeat-containing protein, partial [Microcystis aeruginosa W13-18]|nr:pentapeptide repeat-containing protein [Microcystis aeruginosa W13-18]
MKKAPPNPSANLEGANLSQTDLERTNLQG